MSVKAIGAAIDIANLTPTQKLVLILLANYADADHVCWPSNARLAGETGLSPRGVRQALADLEGMALLVRQERKTAGGKVQSNRLLLTFVCPGADHGSACTPAAPAGAPGQPLPPTPAPPAGVTTLEPSTEPSGASAPEARAGEAEFDLLIEAWSKVAPGKVNPVKAATAFHGALALTTPERLLAAVRRCLAEDPDARRLLLHAWLAEQRWRPWLIEVAAEAKAHGWDGPPAVRAAVVAARSDAFAGSWLDRAAWDADRRAIVARTGLAVERLRELGPLPGVAVIEKGV